MKIGNFVPDADKYVTAYGSQNLTIRRIASVNNAATVHCMVLGANGQVGWHETVSNQLFMVVAGAGWVRGDTGPELPIAVGQAAFWQAGEWHAARTEQGLTAIVLEGQDIKGL